MWTEVVLLPILGGLAIGAIIAPIIHTIEREIKVYKHNKEVRRIDKLWRDYFAVLDGKITAEGGVYDKNREMIKYKNRFSETIEVFEQRHNLTRPTELVPWQ